MPVIRVTPAPMNVNNNLDSSFGVGISTVPPKDIDNNKVEDNAIDNIDEDIIGTNVIDDNLINNILIDDSINEIDSIYDNSIDKTIIDKDPVDEKFTGHDKKYTKLYQTLLGYGKYPLHLYYTPFYPINTYFYIP